MAALLAHFGFAPFSRIQARRAGLESALFEAEMEGRARFIRCAGATATVYNADCELFRMLA